MAQTETAKENVEGGLIFRSSRPLRMAGFACVLVLFTAVYVGFDVNQAIGQSKNLYEIAIPAARILAEMQNETQESRHALMHAFSASDPVGKQAFVMEFNQRQQSIQALLNRLGKLRVPPEGRGRIAAFGLEWKTYVEMCERHPTESPGAAQPRDQQFHHANEAARAIYDYLDTFSRSAAGAIRMAFVRAGFELVLLLLGTLHMISALASNGEKRKALESLRIMNERLRSARSAAEESSKLKSEFLATVSHEIRTPMNGIIGMADLLARSPLSDEQRSYNETVRTSAEALLSILNDILDFSRIEAGKLVIDHTSFNIAEPVFQMADLLSPAAAQKGLEFVVRMAPNLPRIVAGDAGRVRQVLMNLAGNAIKFTPSGHVLVEVEAAGAIDISGQCCIRFAVHDTGIGIPPSKIDALFEKFTQADASTTRRYGGTGLGLAISRRLVELMGGTIDVKSVDGGGSSFSFEIALPVIEPCPVSAPADLAGLDPRVLLIESCETTAKVLSEMLSGLGAGHRSALSAEQAVQILAVDPASWLAVLASSRVQADEPAQFVRLQRLLGKGNRLILLAPRGNPEPGTSNRALRTLSKPVQSSALEEALRQTVAGTALEQPRFAAVSPPAACDLQKLSNSIERENTALLHVLVAEDNLVNQTIVRKLLEEAGCIVDVAVNGRQAISLWEEGSYDLILMDCQMPELDGFEATREIRKREGGGEHVPIIAITANVLDKDRLQCFAVGMDDFLSKPLRLRQLQEAVSRWTSGAADPVVPAAASR